MRAWLVIIGVIVLLPAIWLIYINVNLHTNWGGWSPIVLVYLIPGAILTCLGFFTTPKKKIPNL